MMYKAQDALDRRTIQKIWQAHGGSQHGPHVETMTMPEERFYRDFFPALFAAYESAKFALPAPDCAELIERLHNRAAIARGEGTATARGDAQHFEEAAEALERAQREKRDASEEFEHYLQAEIDAAPEPLRRLGEWLADQFDDDRWATASRLLNGAVAALSAQDAKVAYAEARVAALAGALTEIRDLHGEINPSNYDHDDACELNRQFCYALTIAAEALASLPTAMASSDGKSDTIHQSPSPDEGEWRDIASDEPPHDVPVLLYSPPMFGLPDGLIEVRPYSFGRKGSRSMHSYATHWMPLPASPKGGES